jgi:hypothetical protein
MLFWLGVAAVVGLVVYLGYRYDRKHGGHVGARTTQRHGSVDEAAHVAINSSQQAQGPLG